MKMCRLGRAVYPGPADPQIGIGELELASDKIRKIVRVAPRDDSSLRLLHFLKLRGIGTGGGHGVPPLQFHHVKLRSALKRKTLLFLEY